MPVDRANTLGRMGTRRRLAFVVTHPIQYYAPIYRHLAAREDLEVRVFFTWHGGQAGQFDPGFQREIAWDIPLTDGYEHEVVANVARKPGSHHFWGIRNPGLFAQLLAWKPDAVHVTGYAYESHLRVLRSLTRVGIPVLFRGDSHLLDGRSGLRWWVTQRVLRQIYSWPAAFLYVGQANRAYYRACGVPDERLFHSPHSIEVGRFAEPHESLETTARDWRAELGLGERTKVLLFVGKFEAKKCPLELMAACTTWPAGDWRLLMVGDGDLGNRVRAQAEADPSRFRVLPFQNQSRMPVVYRLGDAFVLPSCRQETWGLAVNEALACGRPVLVSDRVGCAVDAVQVGVNGTVFPVGDWAALRRGWEALCVGPRISPDEIQRSARRFDIPVTADTLVSALDQILST